MTNKKLSPDATSILIHAPLIEHRDAIMRHTLRPPRLDPKILIAIKLKGMNEIEKTREHIDIIRLSTLKRFAVSVVIGMKATWHILLPINARRCAVRKIHLYT
jgi:hypothetical protein